MVEEEEEQQQQKMAMESNEMLEKLNESIGFQTDSIKWVNVHKDKHGNGSRKSENVEQYEMNNTK